MGISYQICPRAGAAADLASPSPSFASNEIVVTTDTHKLYLYQGGATYLIGGNPSTTEGDLIYYHSGADARLAIGGSGTFLQSNGTDPGWSTMSGDATIASGGALTIGSNKITYAKMQQASTVTLLGNPTGSTANVQEITLGSGLSFSGSTLTASGAAPTFTPGSVIFAGSSGALSQDNAAFNWDDSSGYLTVVGKFQAQANSFGTTINGIFGASGLNLSAVLSSTIISASFDIDASGSVAVLTIDLSRGGTSNYFPNIYLVEDSTAGTIVFSSTNTGTYPNIRLTENTRYTGGVTGQNGTLIDGTTVTSGLVTGLPTITPSPDGSVP